MKTIKEWLSELPAPYAKQAIKNARIGILNLEIDIDSKERALMAAFEWRYSKQGLGYWKDIYEKLNHDKVKIALKSSKVLNGPVIGYRVSNRGGARKGAGRKPAIEKKVRIYASVKESKVTEAKEKIKQLVNKLNK